MSTLLNNSSVVECAVVNIYNGTSWVICRVRPTIWFVKSLPPPQLHIAPPLPDASLIDGLSKYTTDNPLLQTLQILVVKYESLSESHCFWDMRGGNAFWVFLEEKIRRKSSYILNISVFCMSLTGGPGRRGIGRQLPALPAAQCSARSFPGTVSLISSAFLAPCQSSDLRESGPLTLGILVKGLLGRLWTLPQSRPTGLSPKAHFWGRSKKES